MFSRLGRIKSWEPVHVEWRAIYSYTLILRLRGYEVEVLAWFSICEPFLFRWRLTGTRTSARLPLHLTSLEFSPTWANSAESLRSWWPGGLTSVPYPTVIYPHAVCLYHITLPSTLPFVSCAQRGKFYNISNRAHGTSLRPIQIAEFRPWRFSRLHFRGPEYISRKILFVLIKYASK